MKIKKTLKTLIFQIGVDCLGFPQFHKNQFIEIEEIYITVYHKRFHTSK